MWYNNRMNVRLEQFSMLKAPWQALDLYGLVTEQQQRLRAINLGANERYRDYRHSLKNVVRIAFKDTVQKEPVKAFVIRDKQEKAALGVATVIRNQTVVHPEEGRFTGYDMDYWLWQDADEDTHLQTGASIIQAAKQIAVKHDGEPTNTNPLTTEGRVASEVDIGLIVTTPTDGEAYNRGLHEAGKAVGLAAIGLPAQLTPGGEADRSDVVRIGQEVQLYYADLAFQQR
jgi:hypothetical protein